MLQLRLCKGWAKWGTGCSMTVSHKAGLPGSHPSGLLMLR